MTLHTSGHYSDVLYLSWWDLCRLAFGAALFTRGLYIRVKLRPHVAPTNDQRYSGVV
jgi:hypothetical protein